MPAINTRQHLPQAGCVTAIKRVGVWLVALWLSGCGSQYPVVERDLSAAAIYHPDPQVVYRDLSQSQTAAYQQFIPPPPPPIPKSRRVLPAVAGNYTVEFSRNSLQLQQDARDILNKLAQQAQYIATITVSGRAKGEPRAASQLALKRAQRVKNYLLSHGEFAGVEFTVRYSGIKALDVVQLEVEALTPEKNRESKRP